MQFLKGIISDRLRKNVGIAQVNPPRGNTESKPIRAPKGVKGQQVGGKPGRKGGKK